MNARDVAPNTTRTFRGLTDIPAERFRVKLTRTVVGILVGVAVGLYGELMPAKVQTGGWILTGVLVAGEWVLFPLRALVALLSDAAPVIRALRRALKGNGA